MNAQYEYRVTATWEGGRKGLLSAESIEPSIQFSSPPEFKGERGFWTPEHFLMAAVASCYVVTFYAMADMSKMEFLSLQLSVDGKLGEPDGRLRFTEIVLKPTLTLVHDEDHDRANRLLDKAEQGCLIARSLACPVLIEALVRRAHEVLAR